MAASPEDRILPVTRGLAALIIPFLAAAVVILYFMPDRSGQLFAWEIRPRMSAMMLGATYLLGVFFFTTVLLGRRWIQVRAGFLPVTAFAALMGVSTLVHYNLFNHQHMAFWIWLVLYLTTPFLVPLVWFLNQRAARNARVPDTPRMPEPVRWFITLVGVTALLVTLTAYIQPQIFIDIWPWTLSPLTARILGGEFALFGAIGVILALDPRWHSIRLFLRWQLASPAFFLVAVYFSQDSFDWSNPLAWVFVVNLTVFFVVGLPALYFWMESRGRAMERGAASAG